jgi:hypothetical protein
MMRDGRPRERQLWCPAKTTRSPRAMASSTQGSDGGDLVGVDVAHAARAAAHEGVPGADQGTGLVGVQADEDHVPRRRRARAGSLSRCARKESA